MSGKIKKTSPLITCLWELAMCRVISGPSAHPHAQGWTALAHHRWTLKCPPGLRFHALFHQLFLAKREKSFLSLENSNWYVIEGKPYLNISSS